MLLATFRPSDPKKIYGFIENGLNLRESYVCCWFHTTEEFKMKVSCKDVADRLGCSYVVATGLVKVLVDRGVANLVEKKFHESGKGKPTRFYEVADEFTFSLKGSDKAPEVAEAPEVVEAPEAGTNGFYDSMDDDDDDYEYGDVA